MSTIIEIRGLGKKYKLAEVQQYLALRNIISKAGKQLFSKRPAGREKEFWALQDIDLDIQPGERVGIIGRNGAGKSTLLKILSKITPPTTGNIILRGRVASLLEVGTGFHPELTGRENIYLNGSILGLKKAEISRQLDAIIDFSGVEKFIDTPLKHYSNGMQLRLAFSVAAHLEPEILLIDEVLAVGDLEFQKKCIGKMEEVSKSHGRTILFVSHNLDSLRKFCPRAVLLEEGKIIEQGNTEKVISFYVSNHLETNAEVIWENGASDYNNEVTLYKAWLHDEHGVTRSRFDTTEKVGVSMDYEIMKRDIAFTHSISVFNQEQVNIFGSHDVTSGNGDLCKKKGRYKATAWIPGNLLADGIFTINVAIFSPNPLDILIHQQNKLSFEMFTDFSKLSARGNYANDFPGVVRPLLDWELVKNN